MAAQAERPGRSLQPESTGEPTLVFEAGIDGGVRDWVSILPARTGHHRVYTFDWPGQDLSDSAPHPPTFNTGADQCHMALEALGVERPVVSGDSLGGALVQVYAATYDVPGVILVEGLTSDVLKPVSTPMRKRGS